MENPNVNKSVAPVQKLELSQDWDKVFPLSDIVLHKNKGCTVHSMRPAPPYYLKLLPFFIFEKMMAIVF